MELPEIEIEWIATNQELGTYTSPHFCWANKNNQQVSQWVTCRDRLTQCVAAGLHDSNVGTRRTTEMHPMCFDEMRLLITGVYQNNVKTFLEKGIPKLLELLHSAEYQIGMKNKTKVFRVSNINHTHKSNGGAYLLVGDELWMRSIPMISMYALLVRASSGHEMPGHVLHTLNTASDNADIASTDRSYISHSLKGMKRILKYGEKIWYPTLKENCPGNSSHECSTTGIKGFSSNYKPFKSSSHWYRNIDADADEGPKEEAA